MGTPVVDGIKLKAGDIVLVKNQDVPDENGIYIVTYKKWKLYEFENNKIPDGTLIKITQGKINKDTVFVYKNIFMPIILDPLSFNVDLLPENY